MLNLANIPAQSARLPPVILIAGPTASGKSALAMTIAQQLGGVIINTDSMQVYSALPVLTAQPSSVDLAKVPHRLYGHVAATQGYSVTQWLAEVAKLLPVLAAARQPALFVGGTGLYFKALTQGLSPVPEIPTERRRHWRQLGQRTTAAELHRMLSACDPVMAVRLRPSDPQRLVRALEVIDATGQSLAYWQSQPGTPLIDLPAAIRIVVAPERQTLRARCDLRFDAMLAAGVLTEIAGFAALGVPANAPIQGALGLQPLLGHLAGARSLDDASVAAKAATRQYAKRQMTWARRFMVDWQWFDPDSDRMDDLLAMVAERNIVS